MLVTDITDITPKKFATDNNGHVCKDKDYSNMQMEKKSKKPYLPNTPMVTTPVCPRGLSVLGLNPGDTAKKLMIVCKYSQTVDRVYDFLDNGSSFSFRYTSWSGHAFRENLSSNTSVRIMIWIEVFVDKEFTLIGRNAIFFS